jgi:hypothetical protein
LDDVLQNALELYKVKHPKQHSFFFIHCWLVLKDVPRWMETPSKVRRRGAAACCCEGNCGRFRYAHEIFGAVARARGEQRSNGHTFELVFN